MLQVAGASTWWLVASCQLPVAWLLWFLQLPLVGGDRCNYAMLSASAAAPTWTLQDSETIDLRLKAAISAYRTQHLHIAHCRELGVRRHLHLRTYKTPRGTFWVRLVRFRGKFWGYFGSVFNHRLNLIKH